jgi:hypothetical protein
VAERSRARGKVRSPFSRGRLAVGLLLVALLAAGVALGLKQLRGGPDLGRLVYATQSSVFERELATGTQRRLAAIPRDTLDSWPDPGGRWLGYVQRRGDLWLLDLETGARWRVADQLTTGRGWTPDRRFVAAEIGSDRDLVAIDPGDRGTDLIVSRFAGGSLVWLDRDRFVTSIGDRLMLIRVSEPSAERLADDMWPLAVSPDGRELLVAEQPQGSDPRLAIASMDDDKLGAKRRVFRGIAYRAAVSRQGFVAFSGRDSSNDGGTWVLESRSKPPRRVSDEQAEQIAWSQDGTSLILLIDGKVSALDLRERRTIRVSPADAYVISIAVVP